MFDRRLKFLLLLVILFNGVLLSRLVYLQVIKHDYYVTETQKLLKRSPRWLETARGSIFDRNGIVLAHDVPEWRVRIHYKLTRLYDVRFYRYFALRYRSTEENANASDREVLDYFMEEYGYQRGRADQMIAELAEICQVPVAEIRSEIDRVNEEIFSTRLWLARKKWYSNNNIERPPAKNKTEYFADYEKCIPDEYSRLRRIYYHTEILEMKVPQKILQPIPREMAMDIERHFNGEFLADNDTNRLITISADKFRNFPHGDAVPHLIGQVSRTREEYERLSFGETLPLPNELAGYRSGDRKGLWGVEYMFESRLHGSRGWQQKDIEGDIINKIEQTVGDDVTITIDIELQKAIQKLFEFNTINMNLSGAAVVIDVPTGEVLAMVSMPTYDLNRFFDEDVLRQLRPNEFDPNIPASTRTAERNLALSHNYQSGSTLKPTNILGGLEHGIINRNTTVNVTLDTKYLPYNPNNIWYSGWEGEPDDIHVTGDINPISAIKRSSNYFPIKIVEILGWERTMDWLKLAGFGRRILAWPDEVYADRSWSSFRETRGFLEPLGLRRRRPDVNDWPIAPLRYLGFGRGSFACSILQIANSMATFSRDGIFLPPTIIKEPSVLRKEYRVAQKNNVDIIREGMYEVVNEYGGTAYNYIYPVPWSPDQVKIYGKTGSTDYSLFGCFAEAFDGRKIAVAIIAEDGAGGGAVAAPIAIDVLIECSKLGYLPEN